MVINDSSERAIKLISDFEDCVQDDELRKDLLQAVQWQRYLKGSKTKQELQTAYEEVGSLRNK